MPKPIVTPELVSQAAEALLAEGVKPSIVTVQARIGGGSYSTVKRELDAWAEQRARAVHVTPPADIIERGAIQTRELWAAALALATEQFAGERAVAQGQIAAAIQARADAETALAQIEAQVEEQARQLESQAQELSGLRSEMLQLRGELTAAQARADELLRQNQEFRADLARTGERTDLARLATELADLRSQVTHAFAARTDQE